MPFSLPQAVARVVAPAPAPATGPFSLLSRMDGITSCSRGSGPWLPAALQLHVFSLLPPNDRALSCRLVSPDAADSLSGPEHCTASLSQPLPPHTVAWAVEAGQQHVRQLPFHHKVWLMCTAAASGSDVNLEVALALLQPSTFPELQSYDEVVHYLGGDYCPGRAAAKAGHPQVLHWLVRRCPGLMWPEEVLEAAARHCDLAGLQVAWEAQQHVFSSSKHIGLRPVLSQGVLDAAAESSTPDAVAKMEWVLQTAMAGAGGGRSKGGSCCRLQTSTVQGAARSGDLGRLRWLRDRGCPMGHGAGQGEAVGEPHVLETALRHADLAVAQWLVDEAGCGLPALACGDDTAAVEGDRTWIELLRAAGKSSDAVAKWQWLQEQRGAPSVFDAEQGVIKELILAAVWAGQAEAVQYLLLILGPGKVLGVGRDALSEAAAHSGSIPVVECLQQAGLVLSHKAYCDGWVFASRLPFIRWLALEAKVSVAGCTREELRNLIVDWPLTTPAHSRDLLEAVQLLAGAGFSDWGGTRLTAADAGRGELDLVRYLMQQGAPLNPDMGTVARAAEAGCGPVLQLLTAQPDCFKPSAIPSYTPYVWAALHGDRATLDALRRLGVPWGGDGEVVSAVSNGCRVPALRWLVENGAPLGSAEDMERAVVSAVQRGRLGAEAAAWLRGLAAGGSGAGVSDGKD